MFHHTLGPQTLGRHVEHDEQSRQYPAPHALTTPTSVVWRHWGPIFNQGTLGSCTGQAMAQCLMTAPWHATGRQLTQLDALTLYQRATTLDNVTGDYPPTDTGSTGLAVAKAAKQFHYIPGYTHVFGIDHAKAAIAAGPFICGTNWYDTMFTPDRISGEVTIGGNLAGGHEYVCIGYLVHQHRWQFLNSWGPHYGVPSGPGHMRGGLFTMSDTTFTRLLDEQGDITQPAG